MPFSNFPQGGGEPGWFTFLIIVVLAIWGGLINYLSRVRSAMRKFNWGELLLEISISAFAGLCAHLRRLLLRLCAHGKSEKGTR